MKRNRYLARLLSALLAACIITTSVAPAFAEEPQAEVSDTAAVPETEPGTGGQEGGVDAAPTEGVEPPVEPEEPTGEALPEEEPATEPEPAPEDAACPICGEVHAEGECPMQETYSSSLTEAELNNGWWEGSGTADDPWLIQTAADLKMLSDKHNELSQTLNEGANAGNPYKGRYFLQTADISLSAYENWRAISAQWGSGAVTSKFGADYNGGGHEITDMTITKLEGSSDVYASLFGRTEGCTIRNLGVSGVINVSANEVAGLVSLAQTSTIINCYSNVMVNNVNTSGQYASAAVFGARIDGSKIINCYAYGAANCGKAGYVGLLVGFSLANTWGQSSVENCFYASDVTTTIENPAANAAKNPIGRTTYITATNNTSKTMEELKDASVLQALNDNRASAAESAGIAASALYEWEAGANGLPKLVASADPELKSVGTVEAVTGAFATVDEAKAMLPKTVEVTLQDESKLSVNLINWATDTQTVTNATGSVTFTGAADIGSAGIGNVAGVSTSVSATVNRQELTAINTTVEAKTGSYERLTDATGLLPMEASITVAGQAEPIVFPVTWALESGIGEVEFSSTKGEHIMIADIGSKYYNPKNLKLTAVINQQSGWEGNGTAGKPWLIQTAVDLKMLSDKSNAYSQIVPEFTSSHTRPYTPEHYFLQTADIDLAEYANWRAIAARYGAGQKTSNFGGNYNGGGHVIKNMTITSLASTDVYASLFGRTNGAVIRNLGVSGNVEVKANEVGGIASFALNSKIVNCYSNVSAIGTDYVESTYAAAGVFIGRADTDTIISNCYAYGKASCKVANRAGLFIGYCRAGAVQLINCFYATDIENTTANAATSAVGSTSGITQTNVAGKTTAEMKDGSMLAALNEKRADAATATGMALGAIYPWSADAEGFPVLTASADPTLKSYGALAVENPEVGVFTTLEDVAKMLPNKITLNLESGDTAEANITGWTVNQEITPAIHAYTVTAQVDCAGVGVVDPGTVAAPTVRILRANVQSISLPTYEYSGVFSTVEEACKTLPAKLTATLENGLTAELAVVWTSDTGSVGAVGTTNDFTGTVDFAANGVQNSKNIPNTVKVKLTRVEDKSFTADLYMPATSLISPPAVMADRVADAEQLAQQAVRPQQMMWYVDAELNLRTTPSGAPVAWSVMEASAAKILPVFYVSDEAAATGLADKLRMNPTLGDSTVCSATPAYVKLICDAAPNVRGMIDYRGAATSIKDMVCTTNENHAKLVLLSENDASLATVRKLQKQLMTVWVDGSSDLHTMILRGADGILNSTPEATIAAIESYSGTAVANKPATIIAHRGVHNSSDLPENSLPAMKKAGELGMDGIEIDIYQTADGRLVIDHDGNTNRMYNGALDVKSSTLAQLRALSFKTKSDEHIATVDEVFETMKAYPNTHIVIEIKDYRPELLDTLKTLMDQYQMYDQAVVITFGEDVLRNIRTTIPQMSTANLNNKSSAQSIKEVYTALQPVNAIYNPPTGNVGAALMKAAHVRGLGIIPWTLTGNALDQRYLEGFTALTTDSPTNYSNVPLRLENTSSATQMTQGERIALTAENVMRAGVNQKAEAGLSVKTLSGPALTLENGSITASEAGRAIYLVGQSMTAPSNGASYVVYSEPKTLRINEPVAPPVTGGMIEVSVKAGQDSWGHVQITKADGSAITAEEITAGTMVRLIATPAAGKRFVKWTRTAGAGEGASLGEQYAYEGTGSVYTDPVLTVVASQAALFTAEFADLTSVDTSKLALDNLTVTGSEETKLIAASGEDFFNASETAYDVYFLGSAASKSLTVAPEMNGAFQNESDSVTIRRGNGAAEPVSYQKITLDSGAVRYVVTPKTYADLTDGETLTIEVRDDNQFANEYIITAHVLQTNPHILLKLRETANSKEYALDLYLSDAKFTQAQVSVALDNAEFEGFKDHTFANDMAAVLAAGVDYTDLGSEVKMEKATYDAAAKTLNVTLVSSIEKNGVVQPTVIDGETKLATFYIKQKGVTPASGLQEKFTVNEAGSTLSDLRFAGLRQDNSLSETQRLVRVKVPGQVTVSGAVKTYMSVDKTNSQVTVTIKDKNGNVLAKSNPEGTISSRYLLDVSVGSGYTIEVTANGYVKLTAANVDVTGHLYRQVVNLQAGDLNGDGAVDATDRAILLEALNSLANENRAALNGEGMVMSSTTVAGVKAIYGDLNGDGLVNGIDLGILLANAK